MYYSRVPLRTRRMTFIPGGKDKKPSGLHKAFVIKLGSCWRCLCHGPFHSNTASPGHPPTLLKDYVNNLASSAQWSIKNFTASDDGEMIVRAIKSGTAVAVCDGSYKEGNRSSAWVLEGEFQEGRIVGTNFPPGSSSGQNSYRSELAGIYGIITMVSTICSLYSLQSGAITIACDNISALTNSLDDLKRPKITSAEHDLLYAIKKKLSSLPIVYWMHHVKGHQDDMLPKEDLDRWSLLNIEMDSLAKSIVQNWTENESGQTIEGEPWSIWMNGLKIINDMEERIYASVHTKLMVEYWIKKQKFPLHHASDIHWEALGLAMKTSTLKSRIFSSKQSVGMCGVGKFMKNGVNVTPMHVHVVENTKMPRMWQGAPTHRPKRSGRHLYLN